jgi:hypothetical protein
MEDVLRCAHLNTMQTIPQINVSKCAHPIPMGITKPDNV